jgi:hypothetical protein
VASGHPSASALGSKQPFAADCTSDCSAGQSDRFGYWERDLPQNKIVVMSLWRS